MSWCRHISWCPLWHDIGYVLMSWCMIIRCHDASYVLISTLSWCHSILMSVMSWCPLCLDVSYIMMNPLCLDVSYVMMSVISWCMLCHDVRYVLMSVMSPCMLCFTKLTYLWRSQYCCRKFWQTEEWYLCIESDLILIIINVVCRDRPVLGRLLHL